MSETLKGTPGVTFAGRFEPVSLLKVPVATKVDDVIRPHNSETGKVYGEYRVAAVLTPGEAATETFAMCYRQASPAKSRTSSSTAAVADAMAQSAAVNAATLQVLAQIAETLKGKK